MIKVLDFGLARAEYAMQTRLTQTGMLVGTPAYLAPEQALGRDTDFRTDIFALGLLLYELASGTNPFAAGNIPATIARIVDEDPPLVVGGAAAECSRAGSHHPALPAERIRPPGIASTHEIIADLERLRADRAAGRTPGSAAVGGRHVAAPESVAVAAMADQPPRDHVGGVRRACCIRRGLRAAGWRRHGTARSCSRVLAAAAAGTSLRLHLWFTALHVSAAACRATGLNTSDGPASATSCFAGVQIAAALGISANHPEFAMLFVGASVAILVASFVIEPATARAAFGALP